MNRARLLLFDVDGTLLLTGGAGTRAMAGAFEELFGIPDAFRNARVAGRTDHWVLSDALALHGLEPEPDLLARFPGSYVRHLRRELQKPGPRKGLMPGVQPLLDALSSNACVQLSLLTGNYRSGARAKLEHFNLWRYFRGGAFGDDVPDRNLLLPLAMAEAGLTGLERSDVVVIGDTPLDVACAVAGGVRCVAVATGDYDRAALEAAGAPTVFEDFSDTTAVVRALTG